jgi:hypothetical protein
MHRHAPYRMATRFRNALLATAVLQTSGVR